MKGSGIRASRIVGYQGAHVYIDDDRADGRSGDACRLARIKEQPE